MCLCTRSTQSRAARQRAGAQSAQPHSMQPARARSRMLAGPRLLGTPRSPAMTAPRTSRTRTSHSPACGGSECAPALPCGEEEDVTLLNEHCSSPLCFSERRTTQRSARLRCHKDGSFTCVRQRALLAAQEGSYCEGTRERNRGSRASPSRHLCVL